ncbi:reverse transcriptase [Cucumis melo var. makuwa]|uniref:Reverse transcriptase n=1 Tax=Cucumis melo var. makuwa TaxID=1194695 RepID=A0A5A7T9C5_CUCMM|nr:reverse transcriptase [Cucumis melo var. makuwa]
MEASEERIERALNEVLQRRKIQTQDRSLNQEHQEPLLRFQDRNQEFQDWSSSNDEEQDRENDGYRRRFQAHYGERRGEPTDYKMKIDLPNYESKRNLEIFLDWLKNTKNFFNYMNTPKRKKVHLVALKLKVGTSA